MASEMVATREKPSLHAHIVHVCRDKDVIYRPSTVLEVKDSAEDTPSSTQSFVDI